MAEHKAATSLSNGEGELIGDLKAELRALIKKALSKRYISTSSFQGLKTGNRYQSVQLDGEVLDGFRKQRADLFDVFKFANRSILDCGCNIGEMSRLARARGAQLVDGYEFDPYFVMIGRLINALNGVTRVSLYEKDLTIPSVYEDVFDVALAFSVFPYIRQTLGELCGHVKEAIVLETHDIKPNLYSTYIEPFRIEFPHHTFVTTTDHGDGEGRRAVLVLARKESMLCGQKGVVTSTLDVQRSCFEFLTQTLSDLRASRRDGVSSISEVVTSSWGSGSDTTRRLDLSGRAYWRSMMEGYLEYRASGSLIDSNPYVVTFRRLYETENGDAALKDLLRTNEDVIARVRRRFMDIDVLASGEGRAHEITPIRILDIGLCPGRKHAVRHGEFDQTIYCDAIDGYHRMFWAKFFGVRKLNALYMINSSIAAGSDGNAGI